MTHSIVLIFFFKQKTAYELRISDWSSDVCSSDLHVLRRQYEQPIAERHTVSNYDFGVRSLPRSQRQDSVMHIDHPVAFLMDQRRQFVHPSAVILIVIGIWLHPLPSSGDQPGLHSVEPGARDHDVKIAYGTADPCRPEERRDGKEGVSTLRSR